MTDGMGRARWLIVVLGSTLAFLGAASWPVTAASPALPAIRKDVPGLVLKGGVRPPRVPEAPQFAPLAASGSYDPDRTADKYAQFQQAAALPVSDATRWQDVGPVGVDNPPGYIGSAEQFDRVAGMASALAVDPADASGNTVFLGNMGGLWKSTDGGAHWTNLSDGKIPSAAVGAIALDPAHPGDIYVGTGITYLTISGDAYGTGFY
ncbi:MAG: hypothetical protein M3010_10410, partial [Candidatus Dormibacteraeota bacterium]|nr:hypothetical protein [Candidatus Dormibacteraeota bacterium]